MCSSSINQEIQSAFASRSEASILPHGYGMRDPEFSWYAVWTRSRQEKVASSMLTTFKVQHYLPLKSELRQWSDRKQMVQTPVFSGYLFVRINPFSMNSRLQVLKSTGIVAFVGNQTGPIAIPDQEIDDIRAVLSAGVAYSAYPSLNKGDRVRVVRGALAGVEGTLVTGNSATRLLVSIEMIRQSLSVNVLRDDVELIQTNPVCTARLGPVRCPSSLIAVDAVVVPRPSYATRR
jgi:transcriptional antiterminator RfaH